MTDSTPRLKLKDPKGWFAAGIQMQQALELLPDGAFKTFVYICLHARRDTGTLETSANALAKNLAKASGTVRSHLRQLQAAGICRCQLTRNPHARGVIEIAEAYWPYDQESENTLEDEETAYVDRVKKHFLQQACVRPAFSLADTRLAREWHAQAIPLERIEQAILLGCVRKYVSWRNGRSRTPIGSLRYFESTLAEISSNAVTQAYGEYLRLKLRRLEKLWVGQQEPSCRPKPLGQWLTK